MQFKDFTLEGWIRQCQWSLMMTMVVALVLYNMWVLRMVRCPASANWAEASIKSTLAAKYDDQLARIDLRLGRWDSSRAFRTFDSAAVGALYAELSAARAVCLATQTSIESLHEILKIAAQWSGPVSLAVYVAGEEMSLLRAFVSWLASCRPEFYSRLAVHVATPAARPAFLSPMPEWARDCTMLPLLSAERTKETVAWRAKNPYPQNMLRNLARKNCHTPYVYLVDVDIVPCNGMAESLDKFLWSAGECARCAYVIPTYELKTSEEFPQNKSELLRLVRKKLAVPFHKKVFIYNQLSSDLRKWEARDGKEPSETHVGYNVTNYKLLYEPFYVARDDAPPHDERFLGYGFTRNSQVYEMYLMGYKFKVLSPIFTIHWGLQSKKRPKWRIKQSRKNYQKFKIYKKELYARYGKDPLHLFTKSVKQNKTKQKSQTKR